MLRFIKGIPSANKSNFEFKMVYSFDKRKQESDRIKTLNPDKIPVVIERADKTTIQNLKKTKYLIDKDMTIGQLMYFLRRDIKLQSYEAMFLFINNIIPTTGEKVSTVYDKHADKDGFMYITYCGENTFG
jgi:GABA(A) receptor-associated protein